MNLEQDLVQVAARAYGERLISQTFLNAIEKADNELTPVLNKVGAYALQNSASNEAKEG